MSHCCTIFAAAMSGGSRNSTRLTGAAACEALRAEGFAEEQVPAVGTMARILNRLGYRLRKVVKAKPQKKIKQTDAIFENIKKKMVRASRPAPSGV